MATVPNTNTFSLQDVIDVVGGTSLSTAFANKFDACFNATYKGSKDRLSNFRDYDTSRVTLTISPTLHNGAGSFDVAVTTTYLNIWNVSSGAAWIHIIGGGPNTSSGSFSVTVDAGAVATSHITITSYATTVNMVINR